MFATVWRVLRHSQDAEDALQMALATTWRERMRIRSHPAPHALILKICSDAAVDAFRRRKRQRIEGNIADIAQRLPSARPPPLEEVIERETFDLLMDAITRLSPNQATALVMRSIQGEPDATIAAALGCGVETVREHLARGRERLRRMLPQLSLAHRAAARTHITDIQETER